MMPVRQSSGLAHTPHLCATQQPVDCWGNYDTALSACHSISVESRSILVSGQSSSNQTTSAVVFVVWQARPRVHYVGLTPVVPPCFFQTVVFENNSCKVSVDRGERFMSERYLESYRYSQNFFG